MSLFKQIALVTALFLLIVLSTIMLLNFKSSEQFIQNQLLSNAEDTASSLALALGGVAANRDDAAVTMQTMISAIFDRGYYESITLFDPQKRVLSQNKAALVVKDTPAWFIRAVGFNAPSASSEISQGWESIGTIEVKSHVGHAYAQLWDIFNELIKTFLILALLFLSLLSLMIKLVLKPLRSIEKQAKAIQNHDFLMLDSVPFTTEFRHVVSAMNGMVGKVKEIFDKEAQSLKKYHELLYTDTQTALYNRRYLALKLGSFLDAQTQVSHGSFILFAFDDLSGVKAKLGYIRFEGFLKAFAALLQQCGKNADDTIAVRMNENDFALLIPTQGLGALKEPLTQFMSAAAQLVQEYELQSLLTLSAGAVCYTPDDTQKNLLAKADFQLAKAKMRNESAIEFADTLEKQTLFLGKQEWVAMLNASMHDNRLKLASQPVAALGEAQKVFHHEVYLRMIDQKGVIHNAGYFLPMLIDLKLSDAVDKHVISLAIHHAKNTAGFNELAININADFLKDPHNLEWLEKTLEQLSKEEALTLSFEATKFTIMKNLELFTKFSQLLKRHGSHFGIDNFSIGSEGLHFLQAIKPHYLKANKSFFLDFQNSESSSANDALSILAGSIGINLIATNVENATEMEQLKNIGIAYVQGSHLANPELLGA